MIYLIGGPPRCGKTMLAKRLSDKLRIPWISADTLESIVLTYTPEKDLKSRFPKNRMRQLTHQSNDEMYTRFSTKEIASAYMKQSKASWDAIETMVQVELYEGHDYVIEGHQIHPLLMKKLMDEYGKRNMRSIVLSRSDTHKIVEGCLKHKAKSDWFIQKTKEPGTYKNIADMIVEYGRFFKKQAEKFGILVVETDTNFKKQIQLAMVKIQNRL